MRDPFIAVILIIAWVLLCLLVGSMASSLHRTPGLWILVAIVFSPLMAFVFLVLAGDAKKGLALLEKEERIRQQHPERKDIQEAALNEMNCPHCGATINPITEDGLHSSEKEPWLLICNQCQNTVEPDL